MIQRIQTLFLLAVFMLSVLLLYFPAYELKEIVVPAEGGSAAVKNFMIPGNALLLILNAAIGVFALLGVFLFKNRRLQLRICNLDMLLTCILVGLLFFVADTMSSGMNQQVHYLFGSYLPLLQLVFLFLATLFIRRDEELVRSADRLR